MPTLRMKVSILDYNLITLSVAHNNTLCVWLNHIVCVYSNFEYHRDWIYIKVDSRFESHPFAGHLLRIICSLNNNPFTVMSKCIRSARLYVRRNRANNQTSVD